MTEVLGLHHVSVLVSDTQRALDFYRDVLGLQQAPGRPDLGFPGAWLAIGQQQLHLLELPRRAASTTSGLHGGRDRHFAVMVTDLEGVRQALETRGIPYSMSRSGRSALFCRDPDGNAVEVIGQ